MLPRVFDPFVQAAPGPEASRGGLGLGLAVVRRLVSAHGGIVSVSSAGCGCGSVFVVRLPLADRTVFTTAAASTDAAVPGGRPVVLDGQLVQPRDEVTLGPRKPAWAAAT
jgi:hypothetical protein